MGQFQQSEEMGRCRPFLALPHFLPLSPALLVPHPFESASGAALDAEQKETKIECERKMKEGSGRRKEKN